MANDITGNCEAVASVELVPDNIDEISPVGVDTNNTGMPITGECAECPPGTVWGCCPDTDVEYPPGYPAFSSCIVLESGGYRQGKNFFKQIGNRIWCDNQGENVVIYDITDTGLVHYKSFGTSVASFPEITDPAHANKRFTSIATIGNRVYLSGDDALGAGGTSTHRLAIWVYDTDGVFQNEYFLTPLNYGMRYGVSTTGSMAEIPGTDFFVYTYTYAIDASYAEKGMIAWYDYYGTVVNIVETASRIPLMFLQVSGNYMWFGYTNGGVEIRNAQTGAFIRKMTNPTGEGDISAWGGQGVDVLSSNGLEDIIVVRHNDSEYWTSAETTNRKFFYRPDGTFLFEIPHSNLLDGYNGNGIHFQYKSWRFGNVIYNGTPKAGANSTISTLYSTGIMIGYDATTGEIVSQPSSPIPSQGVNSQLGYAVFANRDAITMFMSPVSSTGYMKICKMSFYE